MNKKVAVITFEEPAQSYIAYSKIKQIGGADYFKLNQLIIIEKDLTDEKFIIKEKIDREGSNRLFKDSLIGMIIGILGGPIGILFGGIAGELVGVSHNYLDNKKTKTVFDDIGELVKSGKTALLLSFEESDETLLDAVIKTELKGTIIRFDYKQVIEEMKGIQETGN